MSQQTSGVRMRLASRAVARSRAQRVEHEVMELEAFPRNTPVLAIALSLMACGTFGGDDNAPRAIRKYSREIEDL